MPERILCGGVVMPFRFLIIDSFCLLFHTNIRDKVLYSNQTPHEGLFFMANILWKSPTVNNWKAKIATAIGSSDSVIGIVSTASLNPSQLQAPGILVLDRVDANDVATPSKREYISFTGVSGATIYGVSRGLTETAQSHALNSWIEGILAVNAWNDMISYMETEHLADGTHDIFSHVRQVTVTGVSGLSGIRGDVVFVPGSNISIYAASGASGYSRIVLSGPTGAPGQLPLLSVYGPLANATTVTPPLIIEEPGTIKSISAVLFSPVSSASLVIDINNNWSSVFTNQATRLSILGGGTYASTASIGNKTLSPGNLITMDIDNAGGTTLSVLIET